MSVLKTLQNIKSYNNSPRFISIRGYENKYGEIAHQTILTGNCYTNVMKKDIEKLENLHYSDAEYEEERVKMLEKKKRNYEGGEKRTKDSQAQIDAYETPFPGVKVHKETGNVFIQGYGIKKQVIQKGDYPERNKQRKTIIKDQIKKDADLLSDKYKQFYVNNIEEIKMNGETLVLNETHAQYFGKVEENEEGEKIFKIRKEYEV